jgi:hypothetical protein
MLLNIPAEMCGYEKPPCEIAGIRKAAATNKAYIIYRDQNR